MLGTWDLRVGFSGLGRFGFRVLMSSGLGTFGAGAEATADWFTGVLLLFEIQIGFPALNRPGVWALGALLSEGDEGDHRRRTIRIVRQGCDR